MNDEIPTVKEVSEYLKLSVRGTHKLIADNELLASQIGTRSWRVKKSDVDSFLVKNASLANGGYSNDSN
jgi:excisionase family DNA binding protein